MRFRTLLRRTTLVTTALATLGAAPALSIAEPTTLDQGRYTVGTGPRLDPGRADFTVPYRLVRRWRVLASAPTEAIEERVLQTGAVLGQPLFSDVEIRGNTIHLWLAVERPFHDPDRWALYADLADMMVVRCRCAEGSAVVEPDSAAPAGEKQATRYFRFDVENGRSRIDSR
jgi:hypothetical protein